MSTIHEVMRWFPWLTRPQGAAIVEANERFFGFDLDERPCISRSDGQGVDAIDKRGIKVLCHPPVTRAYLGEGRFALRAVIEIDVTVLVENGTDEQVEQHVRAVTETRNRLARKLESTLRIGDFLSDMEIGWLDDERPLLLEQTLKRVKVRGIGTVPNPE